jgi:hypothetical protein
MRFTLAKELGFENRPSNAGARVVKHHHLLKIAGDGVVDLGEDVAIHLHPR